MLPKIASALAEFIAPISQQKSKTTVYPSSATGTSAQDFRKATPPRVQSSKEHPQKDPEQNPKQQQQAQVIPFPKGPLPQEENKAPVTPPSETAGVSQSFLTLLNLFRDQKVTFLAWIGKKNYASGQRSSKKSSTAKRGRILDYKAE